MSSTHDLPQDRAAVQAVPVAYADTETRLGFLRKVYLLFGGTMTVWAATSFLVMNNEATLGWMFNVMGGGFLTFMLIMAALFVVLRMTANTFPLNLIGLGVFGVVEGFLTAPLIYIAMATREGNEEAMVALQSGQLLPGTELAAGGAGIVLQAFLLTVAVFGGLTAYALTTKRDFLWLRGALWAGFALLLGILVLSFFGIGGGLVGGMGWSIAWVVLMAGFVLYDTQNILKHYPANAAPAAAATLFIDFVIMFKYILMLLMRRD